MRLRVAVGALVFMAAACAQDGATTTTAVRVTTSPPVATTTLATEPTLATLAEASAFLAAVGELIGDPEFASDASDPFAGLVVGLGEDACFALDRGNTITVAVDALAVSWVMMIQGAVKDGVIDSDNPAVESVEHEGLVGFMGAVAFAAAYELCPEHWDRVKAEVEAGG